jgi:hypothetical protein
MVESGVMLKRLVLTSLLFAVPGSGWAQTPKETPVQVAQAVGKPVMNGAVPQIQGTGWKYLYKEDNATAPYYVFSKNGHWEMVLASGGAGPTGTYKTSGNTLTLIHDSGETGNYKLRWDGRYLWATGEGETMKLEYNGTAD